MSPSARSPRDLKVLFTSAFRAPFIDDDLISLKALYSVRELTGHGVKQAWRIFRDVFRSDLLFCWFGSVYAGVGVFAARIAGIPSIIVVAGVDAAKDPDLDYGIWLSPWRSKFVRYAVVHATHVLVVDPSLKTALQHLAEYDGSNIRFLPSGYDPELWRPMGEKEREVLTVAVVRDQRNLRRKGIDVLIAAARRIPEIPFTVIGVIPEISRTLDAPANMTFVAPIPRPELLPYYQRSKVYAQPSRREGLPNALCEAMLAGCIPVVSDVNGNPTAAGDTGFVLETLTGEELAAGILRALMLGDEASARPRARIVSVFSKEGRVSELRRLIESSAG